MDELDLGSGYSLRFTCWAPERELNPQYADLPDVERMGAIISCPHSEGAILFDHGPAYGRLYVGRPKWKVISWDPLTLEPSIKSPCCHGYIRGGKWEPA